MYRLDAGSGDKPWPYATVLCDLHVRATPHRDGAPARLDARPFICCDLQYLPFKSRIFMLVYSHHAIEHVLNAELALNELKRVGRHGYIAFPSQFWEWFMSWTFTHEWAIDPSERTHQYAKTRVRRVLKRIKAFIWRTNWRIRLREHMPWIDHLRKSVVGESVIRW